MEQWGRVPWEVTWGFDSNGGVSRGGWADSVLHVQPIPAGFTDFLDTTHTYTETAVIDGQIAIAIVVLFAI